jgi:methionyl-tRNA formyltransferase
VRTVLLANNLLGERIALYLHERNELAGVVLHAPGRRRLMGAVEDLDVPRWTWPDGHRGVNDLEPECLLSVLFGHKIPQEWLAIPSWRAVNVHPSLLPWNRGAAPNAWPIVDGSPAGVTIHEMVAEIDAGDILVQREVDVLPEDTAETLYHRLNESALELFEASWPELRAATPRRQSPGGSSHTMADLAALDLTPEDLAVLDRIRARTFAPFGAEFTRDGARFRARVEIERVDDE